MLRSSDFSASPKGLSEGFLFCFAFYYINFHYLEENDCISVVNFKKISDILNFKIARNLTVISLSKQTNHLEIVGWLNNCFCV